MTRVKKGVHALKNRRNTLRKAKGFRFGRSKKERAANEALAHAGAYAFAHRRDKKNNFRRLWSTQINSILKEQYGISYSKFIGLLNKKKIGVDRKIMADLAEHAPETFNRFVRQSIA
jgi:large subunit ribosomal protein L20